MIVIVTLKSVFGQLKAYPKNDAAHMLAKIAGTATLTDSHLRVADKYGCTIQADSSAEDRAAFEQRLGVKVK